MARIPGAEGLGDAIARPYSSDPRRLSPAVFGAPIGAAVEQAGAQFAAQRDRQEAQADAEARRQAAEAAAEARRQEAERIRERKAAAVGALQRATEDLNGLGDEFGDGVATGTIGKDDADQQWGERTRERIAAALEGVPEAHRAVVQQDLELHAQRLARTKVTPAVRQRNRDDVRAGIVQTLEHTQRLYATDPGRADATMEKALDSLGPLAGMGADDITKAKQSWREGAQYTRAFEAVSAAKNDRKALDRADRLIAESQHLDPQRRAVLSDRVAGYRMALDQRAEMAAARQAREAEARMRQAAAAYDAAATLADKGILSPEYIDRVSGSLSGTPYQAAFRQLIESQRATGPLAAQPISQQRAQLEAINARIAQGGITPELDSRRAELEKVLRGAEQDLERDPLSAGLARGVIDRIAPVDTSSAAGLMQTIAGRTAQAQAVGAWAGRPVSPLTPPEAVQVRTLLETLPVKERAGAVAQLAQALGPQASAGLARQLDGDNRALALAFGMAGSATTQGRPMSELILRGAAAMKDGTSTKNEKQAAVKPNEWKRFVTTELDGLFPDQRLTDAARDAALFMAHGIASEQSGSLDDDDLRRAVRLAVGGEVLEHNGRRIPVPAGVGERGLDQALRGFTAADLERQAPGGKVRAAGAEMSAADFLKRLPDQELIYAGPRRYNVLIGGRPVTNAQGARIVVEVR